MININSYDDDTNKPHPSNNYFDEYYNNYKHNQSVSPPQHENRFSSEVDEDDDGADDNDSYLTDSDLNISEAVFVSEVGPYVSAGENVFVIYPFINIHYLFIYRFFLFSYIS